MAEKVTNYKCLACGGPMAFDANTGKLSASIVIRFIQLKKSRQDMPRKIKKS